MGINEDVIAHLKSQIDSGAGNEERRAFLVNLYNKKVNKSDVIVFKSQSEGKVLLKDIDINWVAWAVCSRHRAFNNHRVMEAALIRLAKEYNQDEFKEALKVAEVVRTLEYETMVNPLGWDVFTMKDKRELLKKYLKTMEGMVKPVGYS